MFMFWQSASEMDKIQSLVLSLRMNTIAPNLTHCVLIKQILGVIKNLL